jgi:hypothetical protein
MFTCSTKTALTCQFVVLFVLYFMFLVLFRLSMGIEQLSSLVGAAVTTVLCRFSVL